MTWKPTASIAHLKMRAEILAKIREFFAIRKVMEVETPSLSHSTIPDPCILSFQVLNTDLYLQTSPEFAMKRLLAAGSGPIYQIAKAFRVDESGRLHNPEFTMLEWYRPGFTHRDLIIEVDALLRRILNCEVSKCETYGDLFQQYLQINPYQTSLEELKDCAQKNQIEVFDAEKFTTVTDWLQLLMAHIIEPHLGQNHQPTVVTDFPIAQAALAKADPYNPLVAERFEVYWKGMELANGFHELCDAKEQRKRFEANNAERCAQGLPEIPLDENFLAALEHGMPACAGVALGIDRLVMAALNLDNIADVIAFPVERA
ncbi:MAG: epmA [Gammaproteobacteria bacterium]|jgi:lysyl-tRNA synthetase class 2|nr:epmA [Gammaproteobacteria bacterium]